jgi:uncharacterized protein YndB with AHSA1/START domain
MVTGDQAAVSEREIALSRVVDAPRELVWRAWTQLEHLERWWGPDGFTTTTHEIDVRVGGVWRFIMHGPDGVDYNNRLTFREVTPPDHLTYVHDEEGAGLVPEFTTTVTFEDVDGKTRVTMRSEFASKADRDRVWEDGAKEGGMQMLARMAGYVQELQTP